jgi:predicted O-methyltransferase YrrM
MPQSDDSRWADVDRYLADRLVRDDPGPAHDAAVSPLQGALLELLARMQHARAILEIGTLEGYSTQWLARGLEPGGRLVTLEADGERADRAREALGGRAEVITGPALETLPRLDGPFDLIFIDADKRSNAAYLEHALRLSRPGTLIVADNVVRGGAVVDADDDDPSVLGVRAFFDALAAEPRVHATAFQTVGVKGHDGLALALVRG